jgi:hypothetical protein
MLGGGESTREQPNAIAAEDLVNEALPEDCECFDATARGSSDHGTSAQGSTARLLGDCNSELLNVLLTIRDEHANGPLPGLLPGKDARSIANIGQADLATAA